MSLLGISVVFIALSIIFFCAWGLINQKRSTTCFIAGVVLSPIDYEKGA